MYNRKVGKHIPICQGTCLIAATGCLNMCPLSTSLIVGPSALWYYQFYANGMTTTVAIVSIFLFGALGCLFTAYFTEPGILPTVDEDSQSSDPNSKPTRPKKLIVLPGEDKRSDLVEFRAKFCRDTGNTIEKFDHFCPWVGNAVGVRNYRYYFSFLVFTTALALMVGITSIVAAVASVNPTPAPAPSPNENKMTPNIGLLWLLVIFCGVILLLVGSLLSYHIPLVSKNMTTNEDMKGVFVAIRNPYDKGCFQNWWIFLGSTVKCPRKSYVCVDSTLGRRGSDNDGEYNGLLGSGSV